ncbi:hypothetical protein [uncultured Helicobacter sp.]|uniref:hypothetical protein n=1 Tax=uncultured Helicobacter sp. TaxID=175537 RepID=UPI00374FB5F7
MNKEKRNIYNVTFNDKQSTPLYQDIEAIEDAVIEYIAMYVKGYHDFKKDIGLGAEHIKLHLEKGSEGEISIEELVNLGNSLRDYLKKFKNPFVDEKGAKIYEWENEGVRFRAVVSERQVRARDTTASQAHTLTNQGTNATSIADVIITFYSDRNLNKKMEFKNPKVEQYYQLCHRVNENLSKNHNKPKPTRRK